MNQTTKSLQQIEEVIAQAIKKVGGAKENDLCKYLPMNSGGYMHHFTLRKMKSKQPEELGSLIERYIIDSDRPQEIAPKQRAARGSRKKRDQVTFTKYQIDRLLSMAKVIGDKEIVSILSPKKSLSSCKRDLINSIRDGHVEVELWNAYAEAASMYSSTPLDPSFPK